MLGGVVCCHQELKINAVSFVIYPQSYYPNFIMFGLNITICWTEFTDVHVFFSVTLYFVIFLLLIYSIFAR